MVSESSPEKEGHPGERPGGRPPRADQRGVLQPGTAFREYLHATGESAALDAAQPWNVAGAVLRDAATYLGERLFGGRRGQRRWDLESGGGDHPEGAAPGGPEEHKLMHWDSSQCRQWCELQKRHRQQGGAAGQPGQDAGSEDSAEDAEEAGVQGKPDQASILDKQQQGEHSAAAAVQPALAEEPVKQAGSEKPLGPRRSTASEAASLEDSAHDDADEKLSAAEGVESERVDITAGASPSGHYDPKNDVILSLEVMGATQTRVIVVSLYVAVLIAAAFLFTEFTMKFTDPDGAFRHHKHGPVINVVVGSLCWLLVTKHLVCYSWRCWRAHVLKKFWTPRRRAACRLIFTELLFVWINLAGYIAPNAYLLASNCDWFSAWIPWSSLLTWTCYNTIFLISVVHAHYGNPWNQPTGTSSDLKDLKNLQNSSGKLLSQRRPDAIVMDAGIGHHWKKLLLWVLFEATVVVVTTFYQYGPGQVPVPPVIPPGQEHDCNEWIYSCNISDAQVGLTVALVSLAYVYFGLYIWYVYGAYTALRAEPYSKYKMGNLIVRLHLRLRCIVVAFFIFSLALLWFVKMRSCQSYIETWAGMLPVQLVTTAVGLAWSYFYMPNDPGEKTPILGVWLQEFAWTEAERTERLRARNATRECLSEEACRDLQRQPLFCFETAMNMLYWSCLVYDYEEALDSKLTLGTAMALYGLEHSELFWEKALDTKLLLAWNAHTIVVAFRGTASLSNALADLQAWQTLHPPKRGRRGRRPCCHIGFHKSWTANGLNVRVKERIISILKGSDMAVEDVRLYVTGHSLGGALATLAAYDIATAAEAAGRQLNLACYTFGCPRVGNHAFARDFEEVVPDAWHVINDQDMVAKAPKFLVLYKRGGQRVIINAFGDMLVRPSFIEVSVRSGGGSVAHHLLGSYQRAFLAILLAQFTRKRFTGGMCGVVRLATSSITVQELLLEEAGLDLAQLRRLSRWGAMAPAIGARINPELQKRMSRHAGPPVLPGASALRRLGEGVASLPRAVLARVPERGSGGGGEGVASPPEPALPGAASAEGRDSLQGGSMRGSAPSHATPDLAPVNKLAASQTEPAPAAFSTPPVSGDVPLRQRFGDSLPGHEQAVAGHIPPGAAPR